MAQKRIRLNNFDAVQPISFSWSFETTSTEGSGRTMSGKLYDTPMFTVEAFDATYTHLTKSQTKSILQAIVKKPSTPYFNLYYYSPYFGEWRTAQFSVGQGSLKVHTLKQGTEEFDEISVRFVGRDKIV